MFILHLAKSGPVADELLSLYKAGKPFHVTKGRPVIRAKNGHKPVEDMRNGIPVWRLEVGHADLH